MMTRQGSCSGSGSGSGGGAGSSSVEKDAGKEGRVRSVSQSDSNLDSKRVFGCRQAVDESFVRISIE